MGKKKLRRFAENATFENMFQRSYEELEEEGFENKGQWCSGFFHNQNPLILELACGKGEYTVELARKFPQKNFIGLDIKGARMWKGCKKSNGENLNNVAFIRTQIELIQFFFGKHEVDEIWITFPDPHLRKSRRKKRLTSPQFLQRYKPLLKEDAIIHLKTDDDVLFEFTKEVIYEYKHNIHLISEDVYRDKVQGPVTDIQTFYEQMWLEKGKRIKYISFTLNKSSMDE
ncbi:MAG: tRNA (guanosine(46)-N7)-methyltransferase TrmB [Bacteroidales bacterium]|nr:tRNA (guanosine(46)-N7)-methyltransferase TrmB [Bacteroidales bacterium]